MSIIASAGRHFVSPLALVEMAAFVGAMLLGWELVGLAILAWHVLRMGVIALRRRTRPPTGVSR